MSSHASNQASKKKREKFKTRHPDGRKIFSLRKKILKREQELKKLMRNPSEEDDKRMSQLRSEIKVIEQKIRKLGKEV